MPRLGGTLASSRAEDGQYVPEQINNHSGMGESNRRRGRPRGGRSMGRNPWLTYSNRLMAERTDWSKTDEGTVQAVERRLRYLGSVVRMLHERIDERTNEPIVSTVNPAKLNEKDITALTRYFLDEIKIANATAKKYTTTMGHITVFAGNPIIDLMRKHPIKKRGLPHGPSTAPKDSYCLDTVLSFLDRAYEIARNAKDWWDVARYGFVVGYVGFGLRPKEYRAIPITDLEIYSHRLKVQYSKTGVPDYTTLLPPMKKHLNQYLDLRTKWMLETGSDPKNGLMVPMLPTKRARSPEWQSYQVRRMFRELREDGMPPIKPKDLRTSFGQIMMDNGATMDQCSKQLRHASIATTQEFYVDLRPDNTYQTLQKLFNRHDL